MKRIYLILSFVLALPLSANLLPSELRKNGALIQKALAPVQVSLQESSAVFFNSQESRSFLFGTIVSEDGLILTKASELDEVADFYVRVGAKKYRSPKLLSRNDQWDLVLVKIEAENLRPVTMDFTEDLAHGTWIVSNGAAERRFRRPRVGMISANKREIPGGSPAVLGVALKVSEEGLVASAVSEGSGAEKAGLKEGDVLREIDGAEIENREEFIKYLSGKGVGEVIQLKVKREAEVIDLAITLVARHKLYPKEMDRNDQLSGGLAQQSARRSGFPMVIQHETTLTRRMMGGPLFTLDGHFLGMNIAAVNRVEVFAIPAKELAEVFTALKP